MTGYTGSAQFFGDACPNCALGVACYILSYASPKELCQWARINSYWNYSISHNLTWYHHARNILGKRTLSNRHSFKAQYQQAVFCARNWRDGRFTKTKLANLKGRVVVSMCHGNSRVFVGVKGTGDILAIPITPPSGIEYTLPGRGTELSSLAFGSPHFLVAGLVNGSVQIWDLQTRTPYRSFSPEVHKGRPVRELQCYEHGNQLATWSTSVCGVNWSAVEMPPSDRGVESVDSPVGDESFRQLIFLNNPQDRGELLFRRSFPEGSTRLTCISYRSTENEHISRRDTVLDSPITLIRSSKRWGNESELASWGKLQHVIAGLGLDLSERPAICLWPIVDYHGDLELSGVECGRSWSDAVLCGEIRLPDDENVGMLAYTPKHNRLALHRFTMCIRGKRLWRISLKNKRLHGQLVQLVPCDGGMAMVVIYRNKVRLFSP